MLKMEIHLELSVPSDELGVNQVIALFQQIQEQLGPLLAAHYLEEVQDQLLGRVLGPRWADEPQRKAPWTCPECGSRRGFNRRGSYPRVLRKSSLGRVAFELRQVTCHHCGHTFSPFPDRLDLGPYQLSTTEFQALAVEVACQTSYARAVEHIRNLAHVRVSTTAVHQWVQDQGADVTFDVTQADGKPMSLDSTKVCAGDNERGCSLKLGLSIQRRYWMNARPRLEVRPVCFGVDKSWSETGHALADASPDRLVFDGDEALIGWVEEAFPDTPKQRGIWHLINQLYWPLWRDGLGRPQARHWIKRLGHIIYHSEQDVRQTRAEVKNLISQLVGAGLDSAAAYLSEAMPYVFTYRERPDAVFCRDQDAESVSISSTGPVERQMREINRRTDVGARWSVAGVERLVGLDLVRRFDPAQWQTLWQLPEQAAPESSVVKLQVRAKAEPPPNVKTT